MPRVRTPPPDDVRDLPVDQYREARKRLVDDAYRQQARAADAAAEYRRELDLARSNIDLVEFRDGAKRRGMSAVQR
jgi:hypothetical protein